MTTTTIVSKIESQKWGQEDPLYGVASWKGTVFDLLYRLRKTLGGSKASMQRRLIARGLAKPIMRMTSFRLDYLFETVPTYGLTDIEIKRLPMTSNRDPHPFIFARKAR